MTSNERDLLALIGKVKSLAHKYDEEKEFHHVTYHTLLRHFILFRQDNSSNSKYKQRFQEQLEVLKAYNGRYCSIPVLGQRHGNSIF